jgi:hypothetical protein
VDDELRAPDHDAWVGVDPSIARYVRSLEVRLNNLAARLELVELIHRDELERKDREIAERDARIAALEREVALLREKVELSSRTSSKPPSLDPPSAPPRPSRRKGKRSRGGQPGHAFHARPLSAVAPAHVVEHRPDRCARCGSDLAGSDPQPLRHQVVDLPVPEPGRIEHRLHALVCRACGARTRARLPDGVPRSGFGPGVEATVATLSGACRLSHRTICQTLLDLFGVQMGLGSVTNVLARVSRWIREAVAEALAHVREADTAKHVDETAWHQRGSDGSNPSGKGAWLWVACTSDVAAFAVALSRAASVAKQLLGAFVHGTVVTDRYTAYSFIEGERHQVCWAHLRRDFERMSERAGESGVIGRKLVAVTKKLFAVWGKWHEGKIDEREWRAEAAAIRFRLRGLLTRGASLGVQPNERSVRSLTRNTCRELLAAEASMWTMVEREGVAMTNNAAERALRHAVLWRRASFGSQSARGAEVVAKLLTVVMTRRLQGRSAHAWLRETCVAALERRPPPSLVAPSI